jgi:lipopolysaccharide/colanic/teichoic acid biosynthesis glycosyltransferase/dTDP-4-dehydrorhamnose reductase
MAGEKKVLVTGAGGFIGSALCSKLLAQGWRVCGTFRSKRSTEQLSNRIKAFLITSIDSATKWNHVLSGIDTVVHLAARVHVMTDVSSDPLAKYRKINVAGTKHLAIEAAKAGVKRFIYISSVKVNGEGGISAYTEEDAEAPQDPYGASKWEAEQELRQISANFGMELVILRPPLVYGPGVKANFLALFNIVSRGIPLPFSWINNRRSFIYLGNLIDSIITCIHHPDAAGQTYLVCDQDNVSTPELIKKIASAMGRPARLFYFPLFLMRLVGRLIGRSAAIDRLIGSLMVDNTKIRTDLKWKPPYTMDHGIGETAKWFVKNYQVIHRQNLRMKRIFDIVLSVFVISISILPMLIISILVKITSKGPILYWSDRIGKNNKIFKMPKFRTMKIDTPPVATHLMKNPETYCTPIGSFLRKSSLDELPQVYSVLMGDMSFVGPRPALFNQDDLVELRTKKGIHHLIPGITGWAQINGRDDLPIPEKVDLDEYYLNNRSFIFDLKTLVMTFLSVINSQGIQH